MFHIKECEVNGYLRDRSIKFKGKLSPNSAVGGLEPPTSER